MDVNLLFVEDEKAIRELMAEALSDGGYAVTTAIDGSAALAELGGDTQFAVVVTDVSMPGDISGIQVAAKAAELQPDARVLVVSGLPLGELPPLPASTEYLAKPYRIPQLFEKIRKLRAPR